MIDIKRVNESVEPGRGIVALKDFSESRILKAIKDNLIHDNDVIYCAKADINHYKIRVHDDNLYHLIRIY